jgi:hypothetical protein
MAWQAPTLDTEQVPGMLCPNCGAHDPYPPTVSDDRTTTCPRCAYRFPVTEEPAELSE